MLDKTLTPEHIRMALLKLVQLAVAGDLEAIKILLDRGIGKAIDADDGASRVLNVNLTVFPGATRELERQIGKRQRLSLCGGGTMEPPGGSHTASVPALPHVPAGVGTSDMDFGAERPERTGDVSPLQGDVLQGQADADG